MLSAYAQLNVGFEILLTRLWALLSALTCSCAIEQMHKRVYAEDMLTLNAATADVPVVANAGKKNSSARLWFPS